jgi:hypothetical protein
MRKHIHSVSRTLAIAGVFLTFVAVACDRTRGANATASVDSAAPIAAAVGGRLTDQSRAMSIATASAGVPMASPAPMKASARNDAQGENISFGNGSLPPSADLSGAMLVRHGEASLEVHRVEEALAHARQTASQFGGFVANTAVRNGKNEQPSATLELRVPTAQFDALLGALGSLGKVESVTANVQDVGEEYVDMGARAANARRMEARLIEMLATRTGKLSDVLTVEQELRRVREEIERYDARLRFLEKHASVSTLDVTLHEPLALIDRPRPGPIVEALALAWERTLGVIAWCIASLGLIVPLGVLVGVGVLVFRRLELPRFGSE